MTNFTLSVAEESIGVTLDSVRRAVGKAWHIKELGKPDRVSFPEGVHIAEAKAAARYILGEQAVYQGVNPYGDSLFTVVDIES